MTFPPAGFGKSRRPRCPDDIPAGGVRQITAAALPREARAELREQLTKPGASGRSPGTARAPTGHANLNRPFPFKPTAGFLAADGLRNRLDAPQSELAEARRRSGSRARRRPHRPSPSGAGGGGLLARLRAAWHGE